MSGGAEAKTLPARILVVEDQETIREVARTILAAAGHEVAVAANGAEAVAAARRAGFDLILMDVYMPVMDGLMAAREIRALEGLYSKVPIIAISGNMQSLAAAGMNDHISKPFRKADLLRKVDAWLGRSATHLPAKSETMAFKEACDLMGRPWALQGLAKLGAQIDEMFGVDVGVSRGDARLAGQAHALVSLAAILGFSALSELCSALEEACRNGLDVRLPFERAKAAASEARKAAAALIADLQGGNSQAPIDRRD